MQAVVHNRQGVVRGLSGEGGVASFRTSRTQPRPSDRTASDRRNPSNPGAAVRHASKYGPTVPKAPCPAPFDELIPEADVPGEDCLNLNIWTPDPSAHLPVMVWLHGVAFSNGSGSVHDSTRFARDSVVLAWSPHPRGWSRLPPLDRDRRLVVPAPASTERARAVPPCPMNIPTTHSSHSGVASPPRLARISPRRRPRRHRTSPAVSLTEASHSELRYDRRRPC